MTDKIELFSAPVPNIGGRPEHDATPENRERVSMLSGLGWSQDRIADALFVTMKTLRKHYAAELKSKKTARARLQANVAIKFWNLFMAGNVAAGREFRAMLAEDAQDGLNPPKLGKKEQAIADAKIPNTRTALGALMARRQDAGAPVN